jgi:PKD repeat protein
VSYFHSLQEPLKKMMNKILTVVLCALCVSNAFAQDVKYCGQTEQTEKLFKHFPDLQREAEGFHQQLEEETRLFAQERGGGEETLIIPIVFHIIHEGGAENISDEQVLDCLRIVNRDFRKQNQDTLQVVDEFVDLIADINIEFRLAQRDPEGNCTKGINRIFSPLTNEGGSQMKDLIFWPRDMYMNVWVCKDAGGAAGYTYLPGSVNNGWLQDQDGIVLLHNYTGSIGTSSVTRSRTLTHEIGHWLNLRHPWGGTNEPAVESNCFDDDGVDDTPLTIGWTTCNLDGESCGSLDNVQNYMDYSYCSRMFTEGQRTRMRAAAFSGVADRNELWTTQNLINTGVFDEEPVLCAADFDVNRRVVCVGEEVQFMDQSFNGNNSWTWDLGDGTTIVGEDVDVHQNPVHVFTEPGLYTITLNTGNGFETVEETKEEFLLVLDQAEQDFPFVEGFENGLGTDMYFVNNPANDMAFEVSTLAAQTGSRSLRLENRNNNVEFNIDELMTRTFNGTSASVVALEYSWAYASKFNETDDRFRIYFSSDCGETWTLRKQHRGMSDLPTTSPTNGNFVPDADEWVTNTIFFDDLEDLTDNLRFKFYFEGRGGNNFYLDDINIYVNTVDVNDIESLENSMVVFPNPSEGRTSLKFENQSAVNDALIYLTDATGRVVTQIYNNALPVGSHQWDLDGSALSSGLYFVVMEMDGKRVSKRLILE